MIKRVDSEVVKKEGELLPGKDIRIRGNAWIRASFRDAGLERVPREPQVRYALQRVVKKKKTWLHDRQNLHIFVAASVMSVGGFL